MDILLFLFLFHVWHSVVIFKGVRARRILITGPEISFFTFMLTQIPFSAGAFDDYRFVFTIVECSTTVFPVFTAPKLPEFTGQLPKFLSTFGASGYKSGRSTSGEVWLPLFIRRCFFTVWISGAAPKIPIGAFTANHGLATHGAFHDVFRSLYMNLHGRS